MAELLFVSLMSENASAFCHALTAYLSASVEAPIRVLGGPWQAAEQRLYRGDAQLGVVCGLQYVLAHDRAEEPGVELLAAPVMAAARYAGRPVYFSDVVVRADSRARSLADLRGAAWAYNERTSHSGYAVTRFALAEQGERGAFFGRVLGSGAHLQSLAWLLDGRVDATAIDSTVLEQELRTRPELAPAIRRVETFGPSPIPPLVASRALPQDLRQRVRAALLAMHADPHGHQVLARAGMSRFVGVTDADYDPIRTMWRAAARLAPWIDDNANAELTREEAQPEGVDARPEVGNGPPEAADGLLEAAAALAPDDLRLSGSRRSRARTPRAGSAPPDRRRATPG